MIRLLLLLILTLEILLILIITVQCIGVWEQFDLVRPFSPAWGSDWQLPYVKISGRNNSGPIVPTEAQFGISIANIGDLDNNGYDDFVVGAAGETSLINNEMLPQTGAIYILFMHSLGKNNIEVLNYTRISSNSNNGPQLLKNAFFGYSVANVGDIDGDNITDILVGAPGARIGGVYLLFMYRNGTVKNNTLYGTGFQNYSYIIKNSYIAQGTPILGYFSRFGSMVATLNDYDEDGIPDFAIGAADASGGSSKVFLCFLNRNGDIKRYVQLSSGYNNAPIYDVFTNFGSSLVLLGDVDGDLIPDLAVGASLGSDGTSALFNSGVIYILRMNRNGTIKQYSTIHALSQAVEGFPIPLQEYDNCGTAITTIGDLNLDTRRGRYPNKIHNPTRGKTFYWNIPDVIVGCPQGNAGILSGRVFGYFLDKWGDNQGYVHIPNERDTIDGYGPKLKAKDQFGASLTYYNDLDGNGIKEIVIGAPGDHDMGYNTGAIYILFLRRRRYHPPVFDWRAYYCSIFIPIGLYCVFCWSAIKFFFWYYRRKPDDIEILVKASNIEITKKRTTRQNKHEFGNKVGVDAYDL